MKTTFDIYEERTYELNLYFEMLTALYEDTLNNQDRKIYYNDDFIKILKSNALIMIYNLVESSIMGGIIEIYDALKQQNVTYTQVRQEIKDIWISYKYNQVYDKNAHHNSYKDKAIEMINYILNDNVLILDKKAADISGNLDAEKIRNICNDHGIIYHLTPKCKGGVKLTEVKDKRNNLAHGTESFMECGRNYTLDDLKNIKDETLIFISDILMGMKQYYDGKCFLKSNS